MNNYRTFMKNWSWLVALALLVGLSAVPAEAQRKQARVWGVISDTEGHPIEGVTVTARTPDTGEVVGEEVTDAEGAYSMLIADATVEYVYRIDKQGFVPWEGPLKVAVKGNAEYNFTLPSSDGQSRMGEDGSFSMHPDAVEPFTRGSEAARAGDFDAATAAFEEVLAVDPQVVPAYVALAAISLQTGDYETAATHASNARELDPANAKALDVEYSARKHSGATVAELSELLTEMEDLVPQRAAAEHAEIGLNYFNAGDMGAAQNALSHALELDPELVSAHFQLGLCLVNQGDSEGAKAHFDKVVELAPDSEEATTAKEMLGYLNS